MKQRQKMFTLAAGLATGGALATALLAGDPAPPQVSVADVNPGTSVERDLCLSVSLAPGAASECGDLRLAHALPAVRTLGRARAPVLLYNSQHASPHPIVAAHVTLPSGNSGLSRVVATLKVNGTPRGQGVWKGSAWPGSGPVRIAVGYDASGDSTGPYRYTLEVRAHYGETTLATTARGELVVVNRRESVFGAGWWLAGLERLVMDPFGKPVLWVGGDGSTRRYTKAGGGDVWGAPSLDRPDSIKPTTTGGWERILGGGVKVEFDAAGRHVATVNRLAHRTGFVYDAQGRVRAVTIPEPDGEVVPVYPAYNRGFTFYYAMDGKLERAESPGVGGTPRVTHLHRNGARVDSIRDADESRVRFGYADASSLRVTSRTDRRGYRTDFGYDAGHRISSSKLWMNAPGTGESNTMTLRAAESVGLASAEMGAVDTARAYALIDGPRAGVADSTRLWLDRWGAPRRIRNGLEQETIVIRENRSYPALVTETRAPNGLVSRAYYGARGNVDSTTVVNPYGDGRNATTRYKYDHPKWLDFPTRTYLPEGDSAAIGYDDAGNRIWQQDGRGEGGRVKFEYYTDPSEPGYAPGLLKAVMRVPRPPQLRTRQQCATREPDSCEEVVDTIHFPAPREEVEYDASGNVSATVTALRFRTSYLNDALGRPVRVRSPIDGDRVRTDTTGYDPSGRVVYQESRGPRMLNASGTLVAEAQTLIVRTRHDENGNVTEVTRRSVPDEAKIDSITTRWTYDAAGRVAAEIAPDATPTTWTDNPRDSTIYDRAGNVVEVRKRRLHSSTGTPLTVRMAYDALSRIMERQTEEVRFAAHTGYVADWATASMPAFRCGFGADAHALNHTYPLYPNDASCGYRIESEVEKFEYDELGNVKLADNAHAQVRRTYHRNGLLKTETQRIRAVAGGDVASSPHLYELAFVYDLNGRRRELHHPSTLLSSGAGSIGDRVRYGYDPATGALESITDPRGLTFTYRYNNRGELDLLTQRSASGAVTTTQGFEYDEDGRQLRHTFVEHGLSGQQQTHYDQRVTYNQRGDLTSATYLAGPAEQTTAEYSGLGQLKRHRQTARAVAPGTTDTETWEANEVFSYDALGNLTLNKSTSSRTIEAGGQTKVLGLFGTRPGADESSLTGSSRENKYERGTGRLSFAEADNGRQDTLVYDRAGNVELNTQSEGTATVSTTTLEDRRSYYSGGDRLRAVDHRRVPRIVADASDSDYSTTFEEYFYDALGRRVLVVSRGDCKLLQGFTGACRLDRVRRTVWDGDHELWEIHMPLTLAENDGDVPNLAHDPDGSYLDPNPYFGRVAYTHGPGVDAPLSITRLAYSDQSKLPNSSTLFPFRQLPPLSLVPLWDRTGEMVLASSGNQNEPRCVPQGAYMQCVPVASPRLFFAYRRANVERISWHGSLPEDKRDASGQLYRRNRYYDPQTGRFTQEDPIGLAGGLNLYGFANGDPVGYSDPFGLKVCYQGSGAANNVAATEKASGTTITLDADNCIKSIVDNPLARGYRGLGEVRRRLRHMAFVTPRTYYVKSLTEGRATWADYGREPFTLRIGVNWESGPSAPYMTTQLPIGGCFPPSAPGRLPALITHELLGHGYWQDTHAHDPSPSGEPYARRIENVYHDAVGEPLRCTNPKLFGIL